MHSRAWMKLTSVLAGAALLLSLAFDGAAQARRGDWADRKAKKARWLQSQTVTPPKPEQSGN